jgi:hypothetical protein
MPFLAIRDVGRGGIVTDQAPYDLELTQFPEGNNVVVTDGKLGKALGYTTVTAVPAAPTGISGWFYSGNNTLVLGTNSKLYRYDGSTVTNVTKTSDATNYSNTSRWQGVQIGTAMMMNNGVEPPQYMYPTGSRFADMPSWPSGAFTKCIKPFNSFLVMAGYEEGSNKYPYTVRWSDEYDPAGVPGSWDITSTTNLAGENILSGKNGALIDQLALNGANIIYAEKGVYLMSFIGAPLVFAFREIFEDDGIINRGAVASFYGRHLVVGQNDIYVHDGNTKQSIADKVVRRRFFSSLADTRSVFCQAVPDRSEVWVCYADSDAADTESANKAMVYNWAQGAWTFIDLPNIRALTLGNNMNTGGGWDIAPGTWATTTEYWSTSSLTTDANSIVMFGAGNADSDIFLLNDTNGFDGSAISAFVEATKIDLDKIAGATANMTKQIMGIYPQIEGTGAVDIQVGVSDTPQDGVAWKPKSTYNIETDKKVDVRASGRYLALRFSSDSATDNWKITGLDIDIRQVARR